MSCVDFSSYIEQKPIETRKELSHGDDLATSLSCLKVESRMSFVHGLCAKTTKTNTHKLEQIINLAIELNKLLKTDETEKWLELIKIMKQT